MMVSEREERHRRRRMARGDRNAEHAVVERLGPFEVADLEHGVPERLDLHRRFLLSWRWWWAGSGGPIQPSADVLAISEVQLYCRRCRVSRCSGALESRSSCGPLLRSLRRRSPLRLLPCLLANTTVSRRSTPRPRAQRRLWPVCIGPTHLVGAIAAHLARAARDLTRTRGRTSGRHRIRSRDARSHTHACPWPAMHHEELQHAKAHCRDADDHLRADRHTDARPSRRARSKEEPPCRTRTGIARASDGSAEGATNFAAATAARSWACCRREGGIETIVRSVCTRATSMAARRATEPANAAGR